MSLDKKISASMFIFILIISLTIANITVHAQPQPTLSIDPPVVDIQVGSDFAVALKIRDVTDLLAWEVWISFDPTQMTAVSVEEGRFLKNVEPTSWLPPEIDNTAGTIHAGAALLFPPGASGSGVLAYLNFKCIGLGSSILNPYDKMLWDSASQPISYVTVVGQVNQWYFKAAYEDYAPSGVPDFDQRQDNWVNPGTGAWTWCGPLALANSLWWSDSKFEPNPMSPPTINDGFPLVTTYGAWDDHDPKNVEPFVNDLGWLMDTDGQRTGSAHNGTRVSDMETGVRLYLASKGLDLMFYVKTVKMPTFEFIEAEVERSEDVVILLGFWQDQDGVWVRVGGHFVTVSGVNSANLTIGFSDPIKDNAEAGLPGRVAPPPPHPHNPVPPYPLHNNASYISHDYYGFGPSPSPGGIWGPSGYEVYDILDNFIGQNIPDAFKDDTGPYKPGWPVFTEVEYAVIVSPTDWFFKAPYDDYTPSGVPDFDQRQDNWTAPSTPIDALAVWQHNEMVAGGGQHGTWDWEIYYSMYTDPDNWWTLGGAAARPIVRDVSPPAPIAFLPGDDMEPAISWYSSNYAIAVWQHWTGSDWDIWYSQFTPNRGWSMPAPVVTIAAVDDTDPAIAFDTNGWAIAVWVHGTAPGPRVMYYSVWNGAAWIGPNNVLSVPYPLNQARMPEIAIDSSHNAITIWTDNSTSVVYYSWINLTTPPPPPMTWTAPAPIPPAPTGMNWQKGISPDNLGNTVAVWGYPGPFGPLPGQEPLLYAQFTSPGKTWTVPASNLTTPSTHGEHPDVAFDFNHTAIAVYTYFAPTTPPAGQLWFSYWNGSTWAPVGGAFAATAGVLPAIGGMDQWPAIAFLPNNKAVIVWQNYPDEDPGPALSNPGEIFYSVYTPPYPPGNWTPATPIVGPSLLAGSDYYVDIASPTGSATTPVSDPPPPPTPPPIWTWCGPLAVSNSLWWFDSKFELGSTPPPTISDSFKLVESYNASWDDHDPRNVPLFVEDLAWYMDTDGRRTGILHKGTDVVDMQFGILWYLKVKGLMPEGDVNGDGIVNGTDTNLVSSAIGWSGAPNATRWEDLDHDGDVDNDDLAIVNATFGQQGKFYEKTVSQPTFEYVEEQVEKSEDVILLLGFWQFDYEIEKWVRVGGHYVTVPGANSKDKAIAFSDPIIDSAEAGGAGHVFPPKPPPHPHAGPPETTHNNATYVSHDYYNVTATVSPGGIWGPAGYSVDYANFEGQNTPEEFGSDQDRFNPALPVVVEVEYAVIVSCRGPNVYAGSSDKNVYALDYEGNLMWSFNTGASVVSVAASLNGTYVAVGSQGNKLFLFNAGGRQLWDKTIPVAYGGLGVGTESDTVGISADGQYVIAAATNGLYAYHLNGTLLWTYGGAFRLAAISADGNYITAINTTGHLYMWDRASSSPLWIRNVNAYWGSIDALGQFIAASTSGNVLLYNRNGTQVWSYPLPKTGITHVDISWDGKTVVSVNDDPSDSLGAELNYFSDTKDGASGWSAADGTPVWTFIPSPHLPTNDFYTVDTSKYGKVTATGGVPDSVYLLWKDGSLMQNLTEPPAQVVTVDLTLTGQYGAAGDRSWKVWFFSKDSNVTLWSFNASGIINSVAIAELYPCMIPFPNHDVAVTNLTVSSATITPGDMLDINVTVANQGDFTESFFDVYVEILRPQPDFLVYHPTPDFIAVQTLAAGDSTTLAFTWNTTGIPAGNYAVTAKVIPVQDEIDIYDNVYTYGVVQIGIHDVAVIDLKPWKTIVGQGYSLKINITIENQGDFNEPVNVTIYLDLATPLGDEVSIGVGPCNIQASENRTITIKWNTTANTQKGNYTISAVYTPVAGETATADNNMTDGFVIVAMVGDVKGLDGWPDGEVNIRDIAAIARSYGSYVGHPKYVPNYDLDCNGDIDIRDVAAAARNFGKVDP